MIIGSGQIGPSTDVPRMLYCWAPDIRAWDSWAPGPNCTPPKIVVGPNFPKNSSTTRITLKHFFLLVFQQCQDFEAEADQEPDQPNQLGDDDSDVDNDDDGDVDNDEEGGGGDDEEDDHSFHLIDQAHRKHPFQVNSFSLKHPLHHLHDLSWSHF